MVALERLLGDEIYYYDDMESFVSQVKMILETRPDEKMLRSLAERYDWRNISQHYEQALERVLGEKASK